MQRGVIHLLPLVVVAIVILGGAYLLLQGKLPTGPLFQNKPDVDLKTTYENPFKKETQYVNPFDKYKNPFTVSR